LAILAGLGLHAVAVVDGTSWLAILPVLATALIAGAASVLAGAFRRRSRESEGPPAEATSGVPDTGAHQATAAAPAEDKPPPPDGIIVDLRGFEEFRRIITTHIERVTGSTDNAAMDILANLRTIEAEVNALLSHLQNRDATHSVEQILRKTEQQAAEKRADIARFQDKESALNRTAEGRVQEIRDEVATLNTHLEGIHAIAQSTRMLSINAAIEASAAGDHGRGFNVIASEVRDLARNSTDLAQSIADGLHTLETKLDASFREIVFDRVATERTMLDALSTGIEDLTSSLEDLISRQRETLLTAQQTGERLKPSVVNLIGSIQFQDITRQQLENVAKGVVAVEALLSSIADSLHGPDRGRTYDAHLHDVLESMFHSYVMESERAAHQGHMEAPTAPPAIELF